MKKFILGILTILMLTGCQGGFPEITPTGKMEGYIRDIITDEPIENASVQIEDIIFATDASGYFPLYRGGASSEDELYLIPNESGNGYSISKAGYYTKTGTTKLQYGQKNLQGYLSPKPSANRYVVTGVVQSKTNGVLEGATVIVNTPYSVNAYQYKVQTDKNGAFTIIDVPEGRVNIYVYKDGSESFSKIVDLSSNWMDDKIVLEDNENKKYGDIQGIISAKGNNELCGYSMIQIGQAGSSFYQYSMCDSAGSYRLMGVPEGEMMVTVKSTGFYQNKSEQVHITAGAINIYNAKMDYIEYVAN